MYQSAFPELPKPGEHWQHQQQEQPQQQHGSPQQQQQPEQAVRINAGGVVFAVAPDTIMQSNKLMALLEANGGIRDPGGLLFLDIDSALFRSWLWRLRLRRLNAGF